MANGNDNGLTTDPNSAKQGGVGGSRRSSDAFRNRSTIPEDRGQRQPSEPTTSPESNKEKFNLADALSPELFAGLYSLVPTNRYSRIVKEEIEKRARDTAFQNLSPRTPNTPRDSRTPEVLGPNPIFNKLIPQALTIKALSATSVLERISNPAALSRSRIPEARRRRVPQSSQAISAKPSSEVLKQIESRGLVPDMPALAPRADRKKAADAVKTATERVETQAEKDIREKYKFTDSTLERAKRTPGSSDVLTRAEQEIRPATKAERRRRAMERAKNSVSAGVGGSLGVRAFGAAKNAVVGTAAAVSDSLFGEGTAAIGGLTTVSGSSFRSRMPESGGQRTPSETAQDSSQQQGQITQGTPAERQQQSVPEQGQPNPFQRGRDAYNQIQQFPERLQRGVDNLQTRGQDLFKQAQDARKRVRQVQRVANSARRGFQTVSRFFGGGGSAAGGGGAGAAGGGGAATAGLTTFALWTLIAISAVVIVLGLAAIITLLAQLAAIDEASKTQTGTVEAQFFENLKVLGGDDATAGISSDLFGEDSAVVKDDAAQMVKELKFFYVSELRSEAEYNKLALGEDKETFIEVTNINFSSRILNNDSSALKLEPFKDYDVAVAVPKAQVDFPNISFGSNNIYQWQPIICDKRAIKPNPVIGNRTTVLCASRVTEHTGISIKFKKPVEPSSVGNRIIVTFGGTITVNHFNKADRSLIGPQTIFLKEQALCIDLLAGSSIECASPDFSKGIKDGTPDTGSDDTGGDVNIPGGTVNAGCPFRLPPGTMPTCTSGFLPNRVLEGIGSSPHYANDLVYGNQEIYSPVEGEVIGSSYWGDGYEEYAGRSLLIQDKNNPAVRIFIAHIMPESNTPKKGQTVTKGQLLGRFRRGAPSKFWTGPHVHFEVRYNGSGRGSNPNEYLKAGCQLSNYVCRP
jgi:hypothetical protein